MMTFKLPDMPVCDQEYGCGDQGCGCWYHTDAAILSYGQACAKAALEEAAKACEEYAIDKWNLYKGRSPYKGNEDGRADPHVQGESCGATDCEGLIRQLSEELK